MQKRKDSFTFKREKLFTLEIQERIYPLTPRKNTQKPLDCCRPLHRCASRPAQQSITSTPSRL